MIKDCSLLDSGAGKYFGDCIRLAKYWLFSENNLKSTRLSLVAKGRFVCDKLKIYKLSKIVIRENKNPMSCNVHLSFMCNRVAKVASMHENSGNTFIVICLSNMALSRLFI